ncbi:ABC1 kinase family protein [Arthrobacter halodurans]|uniref:ABC1 kinase family protein n=1 Tax=Arthrobacter halodurans TaxID=516699 RepID=A0ABV4UTB3_9MICC
MSARRDRFLDIVQTLTRHGLGFALAYLQLEHHVPRNPLARHPAPPDGDSSLPERVRLALEDLGAVYVKLGQIVSTRPDLLPPAYAAELAKLQDASTPVAVEDLRAVVRDELGAAAGPLLESMAESPLATGSIGQAHLARLGGVDVVVKVRRPGVVEQINLDLEVLAELAKRAERASTAVAAFGVASLVEEFSDTLRAELDYLREARNAERFAENFADVPGIHVPRVLWEATTSRVLVLERIRGIKINDAAALRAAGMDTDELASRACEALLKMVFEDGFFHADPHPGNFFVEAGGSLGVIDFGMVGHIDEEFRAQLVRALVAVVERDERRLAASLARMCGASASADLEELERSLGRMLARYVGRPLSEVPLAPAILEVVGLLRRDRLRLPRDAALLAKMLVMADGLGKQVNPEFELTEALAPFTRRLVRESYSPAAIAERLKRLTLEGLRLGSDAPDLIRRLSDVLERGGFDVHLRAAELDRLMDRVERTGNRIVVGVVTAALITAVGELVGAQPRRWRHWPQALFRAGVGGVGALGGYLAWTARRAR